MFTCQVTNYAIIALLTDKDGGNQMGKVVKLTDEVFDLLTEVKAESGFTTMSKAIESLIDRRALIGNLLDDFRAEIIPLLQRSESGNQEVTDEVIKPRRTKQDILAEIRSIEVEYKNRVEFCQDVEEGIRLTTERDNIIGHLFGEINDLDSAGFSE